MSEEHQHPTVDVYLRVAAALVILTVLEVGVFYVPAFHAVLVPVLLVLSAAKFALVVMFYMHLKADSTFFSFCSPSSGKPSEAPCSASAK